MELRLVETDCNAHRCGEDTIDRVEASNLDGSLRILGPQIQRQKGCQQSRQSGMGVYQREIGSAHDMDRKRRTARFVVVAQCMLFVRFLCDFAMLV